MVVAGVLFGRCPVRREVKNIFHANCILTIQQNTASSEGEKRGIGPSGTTHNPSCRARMHSISHADIRTGHNCHSLIVVKIGISHHTTRSAWPLRSLHA